MRKIIHRMVFAVGLLAPGGLAAQAGAEVFPPLQPPPTLRALRSTSKIQVDGRLNESIWQMAPAITDFFCIEPRQGGPYRYTCRVQLCFDERNLYIGVFCKDSLGKKGLRVQDLRRDFAAFENDHFSIQLDPQNLKQYCVAFQVTPLGNQRDLQVFNDDFRDSDWNALWNVRTTLGDSGYVAEFAIPFQSLRYAAAAPGDSVRWGLSLSRLVRREYEVTTLPPVPQSFSPFRMTYAASLVGLELPPPAANIRVEPYLLYQYDQSGKGSTAGPAKLGGDLKWALNPHAVIDLTLNTDFAQAEVDRAVNNLTRFNVFFPERRQFFLENSGIWAGTDDVNLVPFFSRRIDLQGDFNAAPAPLDGGLRYTDRTPNRTLAALYVHQRATANRPGVHYGVLRWTRNYRKENNFGLMLTPQWEEATGAAPAAVNATLTLDGLIRPKDEWTIRYLLTSSYDERSGDWGLAGKFFAGRDRPSNYVGWLSYYVDRRYLPGMGFVF